MAALAILVSACSTGTAPAPGGAPPGSSGPSGPVVGTIEMDHSLDEGYSFHATIQVGQLTKLGQAPAGIKDALTAAGCPHLDPSADAVLPMWVTLRDTTSGGYHAEPNLGIGVQRRTDEQDVGDLADGAQARCFGGTTVLRGSIKARPLPVLISGYYSPAQPDGDRRQVAEPALHLDASGLSKTLACQAHGLTTLVVNKDEGYCVVALDNATG